MTRRRITSGEIKIFKVPRLDEQFLSRVVDEIGSIDIIIDDGSHLNEHVLKTFHYLFPRLSDNGIYVVEDTQSSYWPSWAVRAKTLICVRPQWGF